MKAHEKRVAERVAERLEQIREQAVGHALNPKQADTKVVANLAEEAAQLGLEILEGAKK